MADIANGIDNIGKAAVSLVTAIIGLAIVAVVLSKSSQTASVLQAFFSGVSSLVATAVKPVSGGYNTPLGDTGATGAVSNVAGATGAVSNVAGAVPSIVNAGAAIGNFVGSTSGNDDPFSGAGLTLF